MAVPAPTIDAALVRQMIAAQFPLWSALSVTPVQPGGWDNRTFRLGDKMLVRLPSAASYVAQVEKEHRWLPELAPHLPLPIPLPLAKGAPGKGYPWPWSIYRWIEGTATTPAQITDMNAFALSLASFLAALHRVNATGGPVPGAHNFHRGGMLAIYDAETRAAITALYGRIDMVAAEAVWTTALRSRWQMAPVWVHGDVASGNLLLRDGRLCAVIDFGCCAAGDPACDLAIAFTLLTGDARATFRAALPLDPDTWNRARGWALWKALITVAGKDENAPTSVMAMQVIDAVLADHRRSLDA
jgi:aminoglycoside phosphotransferase (APT) family kinase protein